MKYMAPVDTRHAVSAWAESLDVNDLGGIQIVELAGAEHGFVRNGSRRWLGVFIAVAAAVTGFGFVSHGSEASLLGPAPARSEAARIAQASPDDRSGPTATDPAAPGDAGQPIGLVAPAEGARITSGVTMTGGVVAVEADAREGIGNVHATVSMGELLLGASDVDVSARGPFAFRIPVFPPPFDAPVVLRLQTAPGDGRAGVDVSRAFRLAVPSAVGFWDASPAGSVDARGRIQLQVRGYGPRSARSLDLAIRDARGREIATTSVRIVVDDRIPGASAGRILGLGSFASTLWLPAGADDHLSLRATWRDAATGARLHMDTALAPSR